MSGFRTLFSEGYYFGHVSDTFGTLVVLHCSISAVFPMKVDVHL